MHEDRRFRMIKRKKNRVGVTKIDVDLYWNMSSKSYQDVKGTSLETVGRICAFLSGDVYKVWHPMASDILVFAML